MRHVRWLLVILLYGFSVLCFSKEIIGSGDITSESRSVPPFTAIKIAGDYDVYIKSGETQSVAIDSNPNLLPYIKTEVKNDTLLIYNDSAVTLNSYGQQGIFIVVPYLSSLSLSGPIYLELKNMHLDKFKLELTGATKSLLQGSAKSFDIQAMGQTKLNAKKFQANSVTIDAKGSSQIMVNAEQKLDVKIFGAGSVKYSGNAIVNQQLKGAAIVSKQKENND